MQDCTEFKLHWGYTTT